MRGGVNEFLLDSRAPGGSLSSSSNAKEEYVRAGGATAGKDENVGGYFAQEERRREADAESQVAFLMEETRLWRVANSAQWVAWGIVQARVPGDCPGGEQATEEVAEDVGVGNGNGEDEEGEEDAFDYLAYAKERALFFWADVVGLGIVKREELPGSLVGSLKIVEY